MKFQVGDKVRCYGSSAGGEYPNHGDSVQGVVHAFQGSVIVVEVPGNVPNARRLLFHPKQLRKLVPAKPRRRIWVQESYLREHTLDRPPTINQSLYSEFVEVRRKK